MSSVLERIIRASSVEDHHFDAEYPIVLDANDSLSKLYPKFDNTEHSVLATPLLGWDFSGNDVEQIDLAKKFVVKLNRMLKDTKGFGRVEFLEMLTRFLESFVEKFGIYVGDYQPNEAVSVLLPMVAPAAGRDVVGLILKTCLDLEIWDLTESMILSGIVDHSHYPMLVKKSVSKEEARLICLAVKHATDFFHKDLLLIVKCFLCPTKEASSSMLTVSKRWESEALLAMEATKNANLQSKKAIVAKDASILLMVAYDGFSKSEMCLHFLVSSPNVDDVVLSSCLGRLNMKEIMKLVKYLGKWLKKYEKFPQAVPCESANSMLGLTLCDCAPKLEDVVRWLALVFDQCFTSIVLNSDFHEEIKGLKSVLDSMAFEAKDCCFVSNAIQRLRSTKAS